MILNEQVLVMVVVAAGVGLLLWVFCARPIRSGNALIRRGARGERVFFPDSSPVVVVPILDRVELASISVARIELHCRGTDAVRCADGIKADVKIGFFVRPVQESSAVLKSVKFCGVDGAHDLAKLSATLGPTCEKALRMVASERSFVDCYCERESFKNELLSLVDLTPYGFELEDAAFDYVDQTPCEFFDPNDPLDAKGLAKIDELLKEQAEQDAEA